MNPLREVESLGQSIWLDYMRRDLITTGKLQQLIDEDGVSGITSNPTIFEKAISSGSDYDSAIQEILSNSPQIDSAALFEQLEVEDIRMAADVLRPTYDRTGRATVSSVLRSIRIWPTTLPAALPRRSVYGARWIARTRW